MDLKVEVKGLNAWFHTHHVLKEITIKFKENAVTAIIGPSGCGKSTLLRCINRMHELVPGAKVSGEVLLDGVNIYDNAVDPVVVRRRIGMVFQRPTPFPTMSVFDNVAAGLRLNGMTDRKKLFPIVKESLEKAGLWDEVKDRLNVSGVALSGGQQQRLCIARAIAVNPEVMMFDEPCAFLDPLSAAKVEDLIRELRREYTIIVVTHNLQQASRLSDYTGFLLLGELIEFGETPQVFESPRDKRTEDYLTGKFG